MANQGSAYDLPAPTYDAELVCTTRGTPAGELLRRYWHPVAASVQVRGDAPLLPVTVLGEKLTVFRDPEGGLGLLGTERTYAVQEMGGLVWTYLGPDPTPLLPRWELFARTDLQRSISIRHDFR